MWEEFRMKRFLVGDGSDESEQFGEHVDVTSHAGGKRMLILMVYLNDDFDGGEDGNIEDTGGDPKAALVALVGTPAS